MPSVILMVIFKTYLSPSCLESIGLDRRTILLVSFTGPFCSSHFRTRADGGRQHLENCSYQMSDKVCQLLIPQLEVTHHFYSNFVWLKQACSHTSLKAGSRVQSTECSQGAERAGIISDHNKLLHFDEQVPA